MAPVVAGTAARRRRIPYVITPHGVVNRWGMEQRRPRAKRLSMRLLEGPLLRTAAAVHFTCHAEEEQALALGIPLRSEIIPLGLMTDPASSSPVSAESGAAAPAATGRAPAVLFLSRIDPKKRLDLLIEAHAKLVRRRPGTELWIAGTGAPALLDSLHALADSLGISGDIRWLGHVVGERKADAFARARVFALPSFSENFGIAVAEAMAAGTPVVVSREVGIGGLVEESGSGVVFEGGAGELAVALEEMFTDDVRWTAMSRAAPVAVRERLSLDAFGSNLESMYRRALEARSR
jgi:glycosyltransferase involved in cell wall biosynthesis